MQTAVVSGGLPRAGVLGGILAGLTALFAISLSVGAVPISMAEIAGILLAQAGVAEHHEAETQQLVLLTIRLPRLLFTVLIGAALGIAGAALQGLFRNP